MRLTALAALLLLPTAAAAEEYYDTLTAQDSVIVSLPPQVIHDIHEENVPYIAGIGDVGEQTRNVLERSEMLTDSVLWYGKAICKRRRHDTVELSEIAAEPAPKLVSMSATMSGMVFHLTCP